MALHSSFRPLPHCDFSISVPCAIPPSPKSIFPTIHWMCPPQFHKCIIWSRLEFNSSCLPGFLTVPTPWCPHLPQGETLGIPNFTSYIHTSSPCPDPARGAACYASSPLPLVFSTSAWNAVLFPKWCQIDGTPQSFFIPLFGPLPGATTVYTPAVPWLDVLPESTAASLHLQHPRHRLACGKNKASSLKKLHWTEQISGRWLTFLSLRISSTTLFHKVWVGPVWQLDFQHESALQIPAVA